MQPSFKTQAIILRRTNYGEADRIISLLTPERGKLSAIAKGVRKPKSKLAGGLELLAVSDVTLMTGRGDMALITSARLHQFYGDILHDYDRLQLAYDCMKQINRAAETVSEPDFYYLLQQTFMYLNTRTIDWRLTELWFRLQLGSLLGHGLNVATDRAGQKLQPDTSYDYDLSDQGFYPHDRGRFNADHIKLLRLALAKTPAVLRQVSGVEQVMQDCLWLVRAQDS